MDCATLPADVERETVTEGNDVETMIVAMPDPEKTCGKDEK